jgi:hypothetical protein
MKKSWLFLSVIFGITLLGSSCSKDDSADVSGVIKTLEKGEWIITQFLDDDKDELYHFAGYSFTFSNGVVTASKPGSGSVTGTYKEGSDDSKPKFIIDFGSTEPFDELNEDWEILEKSSSKIRLTHVSGGNGGTDHLTFEKK